MDRRRFVTTTVLGTAGGLLGPAPVSAAKAKPQAPGEAATTDPGPSAVATTTRAGTEDVMGRSDIAHSGIALGGLGTGSAELRKDGRFHNWTCFNNEPQFTGPRLQAESGEVAHGIEKDFRRPKLGVAGVHRRPDLLAQLVLRPETAVSVPAGQRLEIRIG
jgi:hypothetical protein